MNYLSEERKQFILDELDQTGKIHVISIAERLGVTPETIRRDLDALQEQLLVKRVYGGAVKYAQTKTEPHFMKKQMIMQEAKTAIGQTAARLIQDGDTIALDVGTTTLQLAAALRGQQQLTVVTNSLAAANVLNESIEAKRFDGKVILLGGITNPSQRSVTGSLTCEMLAHFRVDKAFLSCGGITPDEISDFDLEESLVSRMMAEKANEVYVLADRSKLANTSFFRICSLDKVDAIICDAPQPAGWSSALSAASVTWLTATGGHEHER